MCIRDRIWGNLIAVDDNAIMVYINRLRSKIEDNARTPDVYKTQELMGARQQMIIAARAAGVQCFDTVFTDLKDMDGFRKDVENIHLMMCIRDRDCTLKARIEGAVYRSVDQYENLPWGGAIR